MKNLLLLISIVMSSQSLKSQNENFEDGSLTNPVPPATIVVTAPNAINGWTVNEGTNLGWGSSGHCTNTTVITGNPNACVLISPGAAGHIDAIIGPSYPIYSVYGNTTTSYPAASVLNGFACYGDWFIKLNNQTPGSSVTRLSKTINVTSANCLLNYAFMNVSEGAQCCCDAPGFSLKLKVGCGPSATYTSCPTYSASPPALSSCTPSGTCSSPGYITSYSSSAISPIWLYSRWKRSTIDLSAFIGNCVTIEVTAFDSPYTSRAGYVYFDAQTAPMQILVNDRSWLIDMPLTLVSTCSTVTSCSITAPEVAGGYTWTAPGAYTVTPGSGGQQISISMTGTYSLTMYPPGGCSPILKLISLVFSAPPFLGVMSVTQTSCTNSLSAVSLSLTSGSPNASILPNYYVSFSPSPPTGTIGVSANSGTYTGLATGINTITIIDSLKCIGKNTVAIAVNPCTGINEKEWSKNILISPNPNSGKFNLEINVGINNGEIKLLNIIGQEVFRQSIKQGKNEINADNLAKGVYYYNIYQNKEPVGKGKIIIE
jgi:hypothetical protein